MAELAIVDLSVAFFEGMPKFPAAWFPAFSVSEVRSPRGQRSRRLTTLQVCSHNGTHVESANHVMSEGATIDAIPLQSFAGFPLIVDLRDVEEGTEVPLEAVRDRLPPEEAEPSSVVLLMTGYNDRRWGETDFWARSPWLSVAAAEYIASLSPALVGLDFQTEKPFEGEFPVHQVLLANDTVLCEYLVNLDQIDPNTLFLAFPVKVFGVEAVAVRAVGIAGVTRR